MVNQSQRSKKTFWLETIIYMLFVALGFIITTTTFNFMDYNATFEVEKGNQIVQMDYHLPAITGPIGGELTTTDKMTPLFDTPEWMQGKDAPKKWCHFICRSQFTTNRSSNCWQMIIHLNYLITFFYFKCSVIIHKVKCRCCDNKTKSYKQHIYNCFQPKSFFRSL